MRPEALAFLLFFWLFFGAPSGAVRADSSIDHLRLSPELRLMVEGGDLETVLAMQNLGLELGLTYRSPQFLKLELTGDLAASEATGDLSGRSFSHGYNARLAFFRRSKVGFDLVASRHDSALSLEGSPRLGQVFTQLGAIVRISPAGLPRLVLDYDHSVLAMRRDDPFVSLSEETRTRTTDRVEGTVTFQGNGSALHLAGSLWSQKEDEISQRLTFLNLSLTDQTELAERWRLRVDGQTRRTILDGGVSGTTSRGPARELTAHVSLLHYGRRLTETTNFQTLHTIADDVEHASNAFTSEAVYSPRPGRDLLLRASCAVQREQALAQGREGEVGLVRAAGALGAEKTFESRSARALGRYTLGLGGTWLDGGSGLLHSHALTTGLRSRGLATFTLDTTADLFFTDDASPLGDTALAYGWLFTAESTALEPMRFGSRLQYRHADSLDALKLRGRVSSTVGSFQLSVERPIGLSWAAAATLYGNWFLQSSQSYASGVGGTAQVTAMSAMGQMSLTGLFQWELDSLAGGPMGPGGRELWTRGDLRAAYLAGGSRIELMLWLWSSSARTAYYAVLSYTRWLEVFP